MRYRIPITRALQADLYAWNTDVQRAMDEYHAHPIAACLATGCDELAEEGLCETHIRDRAEAKQRMRIIRGAK